MASPAEQLAANFNMSAFGKASDLKARLWFTLIALVVYRLGTHIPLPGINPAILAEMFAQKAGGILSMFDMFAGGAVKRMAIFALSIMPYISASIIIQLMTSVIPPLEQLKKEGEQGRRKITQYIRLLTVVLALVQGYGLAVGLESMSGSQGGAVINPGMFFRLSTAITLVGGTMFLMWLGEQISARGVGQGTSMIIFAGIVAELPRAVASTFELGRVGSISPAVIVMLFVLVAAAIAFIVFFERAQRRILVQYPKRQVGMKVMEGQSSHLPLKLNSAGVIPPIFASALLLLPLTVTGFAGADSSMPWLQTMAAHMQHGQPVYMALYTALIVFFTFFYTALVFNPTETADNLKRMGGFVPGIRPGEHTARYLDFVLTRITVVGAAYIAFICLLPELLINQFSLPFYFGGTSLLIVVSTTIDTVSQIHSHLIAHQYEGLLKKNNKMRSRK